MTKELALKYSEVLKAYGEGKTIQAKSIMDNKWLDFESFFKEVDS